MSNFVNKVMMHLHMKKMKSNILLRPKTFEDLSFVLRTKKIFNTFKSRELSVFFMIIHYPEVVLGNGLFDFYLQNHAKVLFNSYEKMCNTGKLMYYVHFWHYAETFKNYFIKWKNQDQYRIVLPLLQEQYQVRQAMTHSYYDGNEDAREQLKKIDTQLTNDMQKIYHGNIETLIEEYSQNPNSTEEIVFRQVHDKFWRDFDISISNNDYSQIPLLLTDVFNMIKKVIPNRLDIHEEYSNTIDTELITQMIHNNALSNESMKKYIQYIFGLIKQLQSASEDSDTQMVEDVIVDMFNKNFPNNHILTFSFGSMFRKLETIVQQLANLNTATESTSS